MNMPRTFFAFAPRGAGLMCAVFYIESGNDVYGWWIGYRDGHFPSAFFKLEGFFSTRTTVFLASDGSDLYGGWKADYSTGKQRKIDPPLPAEESVCHELERLQGEFAEEWLYSEGDEGEMLAYRQQDLPVLDINIKSKKLNKLDKSDVAWTYWSKEFDRDVLDYLTARWPLEYGKE